MADKMLKKELFKKLVDMGVKVTTKMKKAELEKLYAKETHVPEKEPVEPTFLGEGPLSGEYRFYEIAGSVSARNKEEAIEKAKNIMIKHPKLLRK